jgi:hypothetical protein
MNNAMKYAIASATPKSMMRKPQPMPSLEPATKRDPLLGEMLAAVALAGTVIIAMVGFWS